MIDATTLRRLWEDHADRLLLIARAVGEPAEDAVQEAFVALATQAQLPDDPLAWLVRVARNRLLQWRRGQLRRRNRETAVSQQQWFGNDTFVTEQRMDGQSVTEALRRMPSPQREIIVMHLWGEMSFDSIAKIVGGSRASAHRAFKSGLKELKQRFDPENSTVEQQIAKT